MQFLFLLNSRCSKYTNALPCWIVFSISTIFYMKQWICKDALSEGMNEFDVNIFHVCKMRCSRHQKKITNLRKPNVAQTKEVAVLAVVRFLRFSLSPHHRETTVAQNHRGIAFSSSWIHQKKIWILKEAGNILNKKHCANDFQGIHWSVWQKINCRPFALLAHLLGWVGKTNPRNEM